MLVGIAVGYSYTNTGFKAPWFANDDGSFNSSNLTASETDPRWSTNYTGAYAKNVANGVLGLDASGNTDLNGKSIKKVNSIWSDDYDFWIYNIDSTPLFQIDEGSVSAYIGFIGGGQQRVQTPNTILAGQNISIAKNADGTITITSSGGGSGGGNVTSVTATSPLYSSGGVNPDISLSGIVDIAHGGTGASTSLSARNNLNSINITNVKDFGAVGNGITDDTTAIQNAINARGNAGGTVYFPPGNYSITNTIYIGNGNEAAQSTINKIVLRGDSVGGTSDAEMIDMPKSTSSLYWNGAANGIMISIRGPTYGNAIIGLGFDGHGLANTAIKTTHTFSSRFEDLHISRYTGIAIDIDAYDAPVGVAQGANQNSWENIITIDPVGTVAGGMRVGSNIASTSPYLDVAQNSFYNIQLTRSANVAANASLTLRFTDVNTFSNVVMIAHGGSSVGKGLEIIPPAAMLHFPQAINFVNCPVIGTINVTGAWNPCGTGVCHNISFFPFTTGDYDQTPPAGFMGIKDTGLMFGLH